MADESPVVADDQGSSDGRRGFVARATPHARLRSDGTWIARYEGIPDIEGVGDTEDEATQQLVSEFEIWLFHRGGLAALRTIAVEGGSADIAIEELPSDQLEAVSDEVVRRWTSAVEQVPPK